MKNWLKQTSTIGGLLSLAISGVQAYQSGGDVVSAVLAVLGGALLLVKDGKFLKGL
jgi:FAD/FMN-containing dehydrogenase